MPADESQLVPTEERLMWPGLMRQCVAPRGLGTVIAEYLEQSAPCADHTPLQLALPPHAGRGLRVQEMTAASFSTRVRRNLDIFPGHISAAFLGSRHLTRAGGHNTRLNGRACWMLIGACNPITSEGGGGAVDRRRHH